MFKHSLGIWVAPKENAGSKGTTVWNHNGTGMIADFRQGQDLPTAQANARLCAAAPDLLYACIEARKLLNDPDASSFDADAVETLLDRAIARVAP